MLMKMMSMLMIMMMTMKTTDFIYRCFHNQPGLE